MEYRKTIRLKDGRECILRNGTERDGQETLDCFIRTHGETENLSSYPDEIKVTLEQEECFLKNRAESPDELELLAEVDGRIAGLAAMDRIGRYEKVRHRAHFGISILREYWNLGIGRAMTEACIECAKKTGYTQLELEVVADNRKAMAIYESEGFAEYGRNPQGFRSRTSGWQETVLMRLELNR